MADLSPDCPVAKGWFYVDGKAYGYSALLGAARIVSFSVLMVYIGTTSYLAERGKLSTTTGLVFPIYRRILYLAGLCDLGSALLLDVSRSVIHPRGVTQSERFTMELNNLCVLWQIVFTDSSAPPIVNNTSWAVSRALTEGLTIFLVQNGVGWAAIRRSVVLGVAWGIFSLAALTAIDLIPRETTRHAVSLAYYGPPLVAYLLLASLPIRYLPRQVNPTLPNDA